MPGFSAIRSALNSYKAGDTKPLAGILRECARGEAVAVGKTVAKSDSPVFLGLARNAEQSKAKDHKDSINGPLSTRIFSVFHAGGMVNAKDLLALVHREKGEQKLIERVVKARHPTNLIPTGQHYIIFRNSEDAATYRDNADVMRLKINGSYASFDEVNDPVSALRHVYLHTLPDLDYVKEWMSWGRTVQADSSLDNMIRERINLFLQSGSGVDKSLIVLNTALLDKPTPEEKSLALTVPAQQPAVEGSHCVILRHVPSNMDVRKIRDFLWDFSFYSSSPLSIRPVLADKFSGLTTYVLIFDSNAEARRCVRMCDHQRVLYDSSMPIAEAELLEEAV